MSNKIIVFDLDQTIGDFYLIGVLYSQLYNYLNLYTILDSFQDCFRPYIFHLFRTIQDHKQTNKINSVIIYTNNIGGKKWVHGIIQYIHDKLNYQLFDDIIFGHIVLNGNISDTRRKNPYKCFSDLKTILHLNNNSSIIFIDDNHHEKMIHSQVKYILVSPYTYTIDHNRIIENIAHQLPVSIQLQLPPFRHVQYNYYDYLDTTRYITEELMNFIKIK